MATTASLDKQGFVPLYVQVREIIEGRIRSGQWPAGSQIPSEAALCEELGVSRNTVRRALQELVQEGRIRSEKGRGSFVTQPKLEQSLFHFYSFGRDLPKRGYALETRVVRSRPVPLKGKVAADLKVSEGSEGFEVVRLRLIEAVPVSLETSLLPALRFPGLLEEPLANLSIYDLLAARYGVGVTEADEFLEPVVLDSQQAGLLQARRGLPAFRVYRISYTAGGEPVEVRESLIRGDRFQFYVRLR